MNKGSKLKYGWLAILNTKKQLISNTWNLNNINWIKASIHPNADWKK